MLTVGVKNFGPIREGSVTLRPLTIFVGPNNSGKSYLASLVYALSDPFTNLGLAASQPIVELLSAASEVPPSEEVRAWFSRQHRRKGAMYFAKLPNGVREYADQVVSRFIQAFGGLFDQNIQYCFGSAFADLTRKRAKNGLRLSLAQSEPPLNMKMLVRAGKLHVTSWEYDLSDQQIDLAPVAQVSDLAKRAFDLAERIDARFSFVNLLSSVFVAPISSNLFRSSYYFPAARSGILQSYSVLISAAVRRLPWLSIEPGQGPRLSGVAAEFINNLFYLRTLRDENRSHPVAVSKVASFLEGEITKGKIDVEKPKTEFELPEIYYESDDGRFLMHQVSSTVAEIAPVVLFLKYLVKKGDLFIIEEPEAHLHPYNQRILARAIVKLIRLGVHVLITTHSDYFVQQITNFILLSRVSEAQRVKLKKYSKDDYLRVGEVGAYLFKFDKKGQGSVVKELKVTEEDGIPEDQFIEVAEAIYDETIRLERLGART